jgi:hypothetical protein
MAGAGERVAALVVRLTDHTLRIAHAQAGGQGVPPPPLSTYSQVHTLTGERGAARGMWAWAAPPQVQPSAPLVQYLLSLLDGYVHEWAGAWFKASARERQRERDGARASYMCVVDGRVRPPQSLDPAGAARRAPHCRPDHPTT